MIITIVNAIDTTEFELKDYLKQQLPYYMIPKKIFITKEKILLNKNGKIDKSILHKMINENNKKDGI